MGLRIAIVGCGRFAPGFIRLFKNHPMVDNVALCDIVPERVRQNLERFGLTESYETIDDVCRSNVDAVAVMTQPWLHAPQCIQVMESGKHVWSAVPLISLPDPAEMLDWCGRLLEVSHRSGLNYFLAETSYYYPAAMYCRRRVAEGAFGRFVYAEGRYNHDYDWPGYSNLRRVAQIRWGDQWDMSKSGAVPMYYPTHSISGILSVVGARVEKVACLGYRHPDDEWFREDTIHRNSFSNETAFVKLSNGMSARFAEHRRIAGPLYEGFEQICGTDGSFHEFSEGRAAWRTRHSTDETPLAVDDMRDPLPEEVLEAFGRDISEGESLYGGHQGSHAYLVHEFVDSIVRARPPAISSEDAAHWLAVGIAAHKSAMKDGEWVPVAI
jgi:predicted dehydrogenase